MKRPALRRGEAPPGKWVAVLRDWRGVYSALAAHDDESALEWHRSFGGPAVSVIERKAWDKMKEVRE